MNAIHEKKTISFSPLHSFGGAVFFKKYRKSTFLFAHLKKKQYLCSENYILECIKYENNYIFQCIILR